MRFFCEYCGNRIDAEKDHKCPHCGASYKGNKKFKKIEEEMYNQKQIDNENKQRVLKHVLGIFTFSKFFAFIPIIMFLAIFGVIITIITNDVFKIDLENKKETDFNIEEIFDSNDKTESEKITVNFNEFAETKKYKVKVEKYEVVEDIFHKADSGYQLVKFHLIVENITNSEIRKEDVNCIVDGVAQTNDFTSGYSDLPMFISRELAVKGTATFIVPINTTSYDIRYGDYVTIHIEK